jgi:hypothetical protein
VKRLSKADPMLRRRSEVEIDLTRSSKEKPPAGHRISEANGSRSIRASIQWREFV